MNHFFIYLVLKLIAYLASVAANQCLSKTTYSINCERCICDESGTTNCFDTECLTSFDHFSKYGLHLNEEYYLKSAKCEPGFKIGINCASCECSAEGKFKCAPLSSCPGDIGNGELIFTVFDKEVTR